MLEKTLTFKSRGDALVGRLFLPASDKPVSLLLVCHGAGDFKENYFEFCKVLVGHGIGAFAFDFHGHGESGGHRYYVKMEEWVQDIRSALDLLSNQPGVDPNRVGGFGLSSGGTALFETALVDSRLKTIIGLDPTVRNSLSWPLDLTFRFLLLLGSIKKLLTGQELRIPMAKLAKDIHFASSPEVNRVVLDRLKQLGTFLPLPGATESFFVDTIKRVGQIKIPVLIIWGAEDQVDPVKSGRLLYNALTSTRELEVIPGNGHLGHLDVEKERVFSLSTKWVERHLAVA